MNSHKNLTHINVQTNCNLSFSLFTIEELVDYSVMNGIGSLALCERNPYEFLKFYYLCKSSGIKPVWGFKKTVDYNGQRLIVNFFPRKYSEYRELNKFFYEEEKNGIISSLSLREVLSKCLLVLEIHSYEEISLTTRLKLEILQPPGRENSQNIYFGMNFFPSRIEDITGTNTQTIMLPFFSVRSFNWHDHKLLSQLARTSFVSNFADVSLKSVSYLSRANLSDHFESHLDESSRRSSAEFFNRLFFNLENFLSKISLFIKKSSSVEKEEKFKLLKQQCEEKLDLLISSEKKLSYSGVLGKELEIIRKRSYASYFLELAKIVRIFLKNGVEIGPGRGSATSSLISYLLGLTLIDPVQNKLFFWRFLNEKRTDFPDVDIDVENQEAALHLIAKEYGYQSIAKLTVKKRIGWHAAVVASLKIFSTEEKDSAFIEENVSRFLSTQESSGSSLKISYFLEKYHEAFAFAKRIYPLYSGIAPHPSGIVISNEKLSEKLPVRNERGFPLCLYQQRYIANLGFKKFDFLSLTESLSFIKHIKGKNSLKVPTYVELDLDDSKTWNLLKDCLLVGVFQVNTKSFNEIVNTLQPANFTELLLVISLNRPGASILSKEFSQIHSFSEMAKGQQFESESINEILSSTYGRIIFEEQVSQILSHCLGVDFAEAELIRRNLRIIVNDDNDRRKFKLEFISKTTGKLKSFEKDILWEKVIKSIPYLFNKAHATSYTYLTYYTAYLKANFFADSLIYFLHRNVGNHRLTVLLSEEAVLMGYKLETPDINTSFWEWRVDTGIEKVLLMGFSWLERSSHPFFAKIIEERCKNGIFKDWKDLLTRVPQDFDNLKTEDLVMWVGLGLFRSFPGNQQWVNSHFASFKRYARIVSLLEGFPTESLPFLLLPGESHAEHSLSLENQKQWESFHFYPSYLTRWKKLSPSSPRYVRGQLFVLNSGDGHSEDSKQIKVHSILTDIRRTKDYYLLTLLLFNSSLEVFCDFDFYEKNVSLLEIHNEVIFTLENGGEKFKNGLFINNASAFRN